MKYVNQLTLVMTCQSSSAVARNRSVRIGNVSIERRRKGRVWIQSVEGEKGDVKKGSTCTKLCFQVLDVKKPLMSVKRIVEKGNKVGLGPKDEDNYILNEISGDKILLKPNGRGSYLMDVMLAG